jgi:phage-related protein
MREIVFYRTLSGKCPVEEFLDCLPAKEAQKVTWVLRLIEDLPRIPERYLKKLAGTDDIWEVRISMAGNIFRILGFWDGPRLLVLTHAFQKKTRKTPRQAIKIAEARKSDYLQRRNQK